MERPEASGPNIIPILDFLYLDKIFIKLTIEICFLLTSLLLAVEAKIKSSNPKNVDAFKNIAYRIIAFLLLLGGLISSFSPIINNSANDNFLNSIVPLIADDDFFSAITGIFGFSLLALMFLLPATHLSNTIKNNILISRLNIFTILSIFYFLSASQYTYLWMVSDLEVDRNIAIIKEAKISTSLALVIKLSVIVLLFFCLRDACDTLILFNR